MLKTYRDLPNIRFPIYPLPDDNWSLTDGLLFVEGQIADDKNMPGDNLGIRRLQTPRKGLYNLKRGLSNVHGLLTSSSKNFIDFDGVPFTYLKTAYQELVHYKIMKVVKKETASLIWFHGISFPFEVPRPPPEPASYARILHFKRMPWIIYDFTYEKGKDTRRMV